MTLSLSSSLSSSSSHDDDGLSIVGSHLELLDDDGHDHDHDLIDDSTRSNNVIVKSFGGDGGMSDEDEKKKSVDAEEMEAEATAPIMTEVEEIGAVIMPAEPKAIHL